jgi:hypothetical protein
VRNGCSFCALIQVGKGLRKMCSYCAYTNKSNVNNFPLYVVTVAALFGTLTAVGLLFCKLSNYCVELLAKLWDQFLIASLSCAAVALCLN